MASESLNREVKQGLNGHVRPKDRLKRSSLVSKESSSGVIEVDITTVPWNVEFLFEEVEKRFTVLVVQRDINVVQADDAQLESGFESASKGESLVVRDLYADVKFGLGEGFGAELGKVERKRLGVSELDVSREVEGGHFSLLGKVGLAEEGLKLLCSYASHVKVLGVRPRNFCVGSVRDSVGHGR